MPTPERHLAATAAAQLGLFTRADARRAGLSPKQLHLRLDRGLYQRIGAGVFLVTGAPPTWEQRALAALLAVGRGARLSHRAAAHLLGFDGFGEGRIDVTVRRGTRSGTRLAVVHGTRALDRIDEFHVGRFPVTSAARTIIDLCAIGAGERELTAAIGSALRDGHASEPFLRQRLAALRGPGRAGVRLLDAVLAGPIGHSHLERAFVRLLARAGITAPEAQQAFAGERVIRVDFLWPAERVVVEVMGHRFHATRQQLQRDAQRRNELQELGHFVIELTSEDVARRPVQCVTRVRRVLRTRSCERIVPPGHETLT